MPTKTPHLDHQRGVVRAGSSGLGVTPAPLLVAVPPVPPLAVVGAADPFAAFLTATRENSHFEIHREEEVSVTSTRFCGGDWWWQLCSASGDVQAEAGGYLSEAACRSAIASIKAEAGLASVRLRS